MALQPEDQHFFTERVPQLMRTLSPSQTPLWGGMSPQHMVEHLVGSWMISNGRATSQLAIPEAKLPSYREFLFSDEEYAQNVPNPVFSKGLPPLRKPTLEAAIDTLEAEINRFFRYHDENPGATFTHPVFGVLDKKGWLLFQTKHMKHHMRQFGLL